MNGIKNVIDNLWSIGMVVIYLEVVTYTFIQIYVVLRAKIIYTGIHGGYYNEIQNKMCTSNKCNLNNYNG